LNVRLDYYKRHASGVLESFLGDLADAIDAAVAAGDGDGATRLRGLWLDHFEVQLPAMGAVDLIDYLETRQVWRQEGDRVAFKTADVPCISYTAQLEDAGAVRLVALAACYRYPGGEENWWTGLVAPRLRSL
jgi:hypothetical protein